MIQRKERKEIRTRREKKKRKAMSQWLKNKKEQEKGICLSLTNARSLHARIDQSVPSLRNGLTNNFLDIGVPMIFQ